ncbi:MAG: helix-hairpin-helix domain-containing protein, partial [Bdellovibrionaceae bacterium]|nr:helix-hairpin-helix domain-containing protein [Pseudobdellovibrionaceae bacterium]
MDANFVSFLAKLVPGVSPRAAQAVLDLAAEGATVPFIARYRKEKTGNLDEVSIRGILAAKENYDEIVKRKAFLIKEIGEQGNLTEEIRRRIQLAWDLGELEEIYRPFKKKKKTKATLAREAGLEPLADWLWKVGHGELSSDETMEVRAKAFINPGHKIFTYDEALKGAQDIIIERLTNTAELRSLVVQNYLEKGKVISKAAKGYKPNSKYEMYREFEDSVKALREPKASHRYLAMRRGWQEEELNLEIKGDDEMLLAHYEKFATTTPDNNIGSWLKAAAKTALQVYVIPSVVNEVHRVLKEAADEHAIRVFAENVRKVLLSSPFGPKVVLGVDPGIRTGCKIALVDKSGNFISHTVLHTQGDGAEEKARQLFAELLKQIRIDAIAVGNGTNGRQTESFLRKVLKDLGENVPVIMVNESGASVYSASDVAREEFPDLDVTVRGAISIARRLQDPLSELVKVDPKSIGVGQYQHDVSQSQLKKSLEAVVESCVNSVGVDLNTASAQLLSHVSGIGPAMAQNIVEHRKKSGLFATRDELLKVPRFT